MKFSMIIEVQISSPNASLERQAFHDCLEQAILADELGYHCIWAVEHHGLLEYSHCSAPEIFLSFVAARTKRIRIGHGVTLTPHRYNHPIRVAERVATLDILSDGRVNWGSGKSMTPVEQGAFEVDKEHLEGQWRDAIQMIPQMWGSDVFEWNSPYYQIPPTQIIPKPVQRPHPPLFSACSRHETVLQAGQLGIGALNFVTGSEENLVQRMAAYRQAISEVTASQRRVNNHYACTPTSIVLDDDRKACEHGFRGARFFAEELTFYFGSGLRPLGPLDVNRDALTSAELRKAMDGRGTPGASLQSVTGDPVAARETVSRFVDHGVDELILIMQLGTVPHAIVLESIRTFGEKVMPHFS